MGKYPTHESDNLKQYILQKWWRGMKKITQNKALKKKMERTVISLAVKIKNDIPDNPSPI